MTASTAQGTDHSTNPGNRDRDRIRDTNGTRRGFRTFRQGSRRQRLELASMLVGTALLYLWGLGASGWANAFYSAAAQAGAQNWTAWFFGSSDAANSITVDKPPAALWVTGLSVRLFGLNSWSILVPQALMGVATAWILYLAVRRAALPATGNDRMAHRAGLLAAAVLALTPVATLMFRFNNPDALLVLLMTAAAYGVLRAIQEQRMRWLVLAGVFLGMGFLTKQLQVLLVVPGFAFAYLIAAQPKVGKRVMHLLAAAGAMAVSAGWWLAAVELVPAQLRPYIGGSQDNSIMDLTFGYNGFGRLNGDETGSVGGGNGWGQPGLFRMFGAEFGGQIAWLIPSALILGGALLWLGRRAPRTDVVHASVLVWGSWLLVTGLVFSFMAGIIHPYYAVALAPGIAGLTGLGGVLLWQRRSQVSTAAVLALAVVAAGLTANSVLASAPTFLPWLRWIILLGSIAAGAALLVPGGWSSVLVTRTTAGLAIAASLTGPLAYSVATASVPHTGAIVSAGPAVTAGFGPGFGGNRPPRGITRPNAALGGTGAGPAGGPGGGMGGLLDTAAPSSDVVAALQTDAGSYTWAAAVVGSNNAAGYQLATGLPVMAVGGFNGTDPSPTLAQFQQDVTDGKIHYFIASQMMRGDSGSDTATQIAAWVAANYEAQTIGNTTVYSLHG
ncbi:glycosyltransferase family 39 protein [Arthrobacter sp. fls2-241-R2A-200]|uniref:ArnT family glycosyltransferase n=1 Tax=Arthrobacter sp. fls2-241-R2A-200 TaxID=3040281 RepID=UPI0025503BEA|nr:glycosyltransferase family 39 protein [Arthrobacter sp. fls2-241-R2A-200]